jgi:molybdate transport system substrate-binding protein
LPQLSLKVASDASLHSSTKDSQRYSGMHESRFAAELLSAGRRGPIVPENSSWSKDWVVGVRVWLERRGHAILGKGRLELLEGIDRWRSISAAARDMGMSYRHAWLLVQSINQAAGSRLVESAVGGSAGGGARLTRRGRAVVAVFRALQNQVHQKAAAILPGLVHKPAPAALHVAAAVSLEEVLGQLVVDYALLRPTIPVRTVFGGSDELASQMVGGAPADLFLAADDRQLDILQASGLLERRTRVPFAENSLAAIAPLDSPLVITAPAQLVNDPGLRVALAQPSCPLGSYSRAYLDRLHVYDRLVQQVIVVDNSRAVITVVRAGQADVGFVYTSDAFSTADCRLLFRARPRGIPIRFTGAVLRPAERYDEARRFLRFLVSPGAQRRFRACGFTSPRRRK